MFDDLPNEVLVHIFLFAYAFHPSFQYCRGVGRLLAPVVRDYPLLVVSDVMLRELRAERDQEFERHSEILRQIKFVQLILHL